MLNENGQHNMDRMQGGSGQEDLNGPLGSQVEEPHRVPEVGMGFPSQPVPLGSFRQCTPQGNRPSSSIPHLPSRSLPLPALGSI